MTFIDLLIIKIGCVNYARFPKSNHIFQFSVLSTTLHNTYGAAVQLFVVGEGKIPSTEGTSQGDPLAMAMYVLAVLPLIIQLHAATPEAGQAWFADDATAVSSLSFLLQWW